MSTVSPAFFRHAAFSLSCPRCAAQADNRGDELPEEEAARSNPLISQGPLLKDIDGNSGRPRLELRSHRREGTRPLSYPRKFKEQELSGEDQTGGEVTPDAFRRLISICRPGLFQFSAGCWSFRISRALRAGLGEESSQDM